MDYLVIPTNKIGGSEVRLTRNWVFSKKVISEYNCKLIISEKLFDALSSRTELFRDLKLLEKDIIFFSFKESYLDLQKQLKYLINNLNNAKKIIFLLHVPHFVKVKTKVVYIHPGTSFIKNSNYKGIIGQVLNIIFSNKIDCLDPIIYKNFRRLFFYRKNDFSLTKFGINESIVALSQGINYEQKRNDLIFLGRLTPLKQVLQLLESIELSYNTVKTDFEDVRFIVIGDGPLKEKVDQKINRLKAKNVPILFIKSSNPFKYLFQAKGYFSLQLYNNYPSQSLIESIFCGCLPIITDSGCSKDFIPEEFSFFIPEKFTEKDIARACYNLLSNNNNTASSIKLINYLKNKYLEIEMANYYYNI